MAITSRFPIGTHVMDKEWDVLVVLDTCRYDAMQDVADEYDFIEDVGKIWSRGAHSVEWISHTFSTDHRTELSETAYISANPFSKVVIDQHHQNTDESAAKRIRKYGDWDLISPEDLAHLEHVWEYDLDTADVKQLKEEGSIPEHVTLPEHITDRGIDVWRNRQPERMILHYWQPHKPFIANALKERRSLKPHEEEFFEYLRDTDDKETVYETFLDELRYVLDSVAVLLGNIDAETVAITADHGEAMGEYGDYNHPMGILNPYVRYVPWVETTATDTGGYTPTTKLETRTDASVDETLEALGYK